jgi:Flp pilus assembly pilin Flp
MNNRYLAQFPALVPGQISRRPMAVHLVQLELLTRRSTIEVLRTRLRSERGAATAEYAITTLAAVGFAGLLVVVLRSSEVRGMLTDIVRNALSIPA